MSCSLSSVAPATVLFPAAAGTSSRAAPAPVAPCCSDLHALSARASLGIGATSLGPGSLSLIASSGSAVQNIWLTGVGALAVYKGLIRRDGRSSRTGARQSPQVASMGDDTVQLTLATFNIRGIMDRWAEREEVLRECLREIDADVYAFQEVLTGDFEQDRQLLGPAYVVHSCHAALQELVHRGGVYRYFAHAMRSLNQSWLVGSWFRRLPLVVEQWREYLHVESPMLRNLRDVLMMPFFGNSLATRLRCQELSHDLLVLGGFRAAQRLLIHVPPQDSGSSSRQQQQQQQQDSAGGIGVAGLASSAPPPAGSVGGGIGLGARAASCSAAAVNASAGGRGEGPRGDVACSGVDSSSSRVGAASGGESGAADGGFRVWVVNTHLDHEHADMRAQQAVAVVQWMDKVKHMADAIILSGDFNGGPHEPFHVLLDDKGFRSAHRSAHGVEPQGTWPSGIQAPFAEDGDLECLDYVYIWEADGVMCRVSAAELRGTVPSRSDSTLYPSDHLALRVTFGLQRLAAAVQQVDDGMEEGEAATAAAASLPLAVMPLPVGQPAGRDMLGAGGGGALDALGSAAHALMGVGGLGAALK